MLDRLLAALAIAALAATPALADGLLFSMSGSKGAVAERAAGSAVPIFGQGATVVADGRSGAALAFDMPAFAWSAPGNIYAQRGTLSFFFRARTPLGTTPFPIFRAGSSDGSSWDMTFLRIDWNGHGYDAFVTDTGLARTRVSFRAPSIPAADAWTHIAFAWDEANGVRLWIDGRPVARSDRRAVYDAGLFGFGPFHRVISPYQVQTAYNFLRTGDIDEVRVYDHMLGDAQVAALSRVEEPAVEAAPAATDAAWRLRYGWTGAAPAYLADAATRIRKVEFTDTRDVKEKMFRGTDGIRETTWPGVYNRSRLLGRHDYFELPDWNVYSTGGKSYVLTLPDEPWNRIEISGPAYGSLSAGGDVLLKRPQGLERTSTQFGRARRGGTLRFDNTAQETPIEEIAAYNVAPGAAPEGAPTLSYTVDASADPAAYPALDAARAFIDGRFVAGERATVVALPDGAPRGKAAARGAGLPIVHILVPGDFRDARPGGAPQRFGYGAQALDAGLDGVAIDLPAMDTKATHGGLLPLNIRIKDPTWPERDLLDVNVSVKPGEARTLWLDTRDRILPRGANIAIDIAAAGGGFGPASLDGARIRLVYKSAAAARSEHVADRFEQARDNLAFLVEEQPNNRLYPVWSRFERDITDVLRVDPDNAVARAYWVEKNPDQPYAPFTQPQPPAGVPLWAFRQTEDLKLFKRFVDWWIDNRQTPDGEFGGGLSDDVDLTNQWVPLALMGIDPDRYAASQRRMLDATYANGMWTGGLSRIRADELHSYEEGINAVAQSMTISWGDPTAIERGMAVAREYPRLIQTNAAGHAHVVSSYYSGSDIVREGVWGWQRPYSLLVTHPGLLLVNYNGAPKVRSLVLPLLDGWLAHGTQDASGDWSFPSEIEWATDKARGSGVVSAAHVFWAGYSFTGDEKYLRPIAPAIRRGNLPGVSLLNADLVARAPGGAALADRIVKGDAAPTGAAIDRNLGGATDDDFARFVRWQKTGDKSLLSALYAEEIEADSQRMHLLTEGHFWSDRVSVPSELLQRSRLGGVGHRRNAYFPGNLVRWRFTGGRGEDVAILVTGGDPKKFTVVAYNLSDKPVTATMTGDELAPGTWRMTDGVDGNEDDRADTPSAPAEVVLERGRGTTLVLPPRQTMAFSFALAAPGDNPATRPDVGLSADDLVLKGRRLAITVHGLGAKPTPAGTAIVEDLDGKQLGSVRFAGLPAPVDLAPKTATVTVSLPARTGGARVRLALDGAPAEVTANNNVATLGATIASGSK